MRVHFEKILPARTQSFACREFRSRTFTAPYHFHPEYELTAIVAGRGRRFVADSIEEFEPGDLVLLGQNVPHRWASIPTERAPRAGSLVLQFRYDFLGKTFWDAPEFATVRGLLQRAERGLYFPPQVFREVQPLLAQLADRTGVGRVTGLLEILGRLDMDAARPLATRGYRAETAVRDAARIDRVISHVETAYPDDTLTLAGAARLVALTPGAFSRFFSRTTGRTFVDYVNEVRLSHVCRLLAETDRAVAEICFACGFGTMSNFHQRFREAKRTTPLAYRRLFQTAPAVAVPRRFVDRPPSGADEA